MVWLLFKIMKKGLLHLNQSLIPNTLNNNYVSLLQLLLRNKDNTVYFTQKCKIFPNIPWTFFSYFIPFPKTCVMNKILIKTQKIMGHSKKEIFIYI